MIVQDPLYGRFQLPSKLDRLLLAPEVRRLSQIRLLNTATPSLATLGDLRRYSHTLGVLHLALSSRQVGYTPGERDALAASVILHDIGTPPFGHLMEYHLKERTGWSHEDAIHDLLWGFHAPENRAHQIFAGRSLTVRTVLRRIGIDLELVQAIITRQHPLSALLFGSIDFDNLDNVARMAWALGIPCPPSLPVDLAKGLSVTRGGVLQLSHGRHGESIQQWARLRRQVYDILAFDPPTVAAQAVLSEAIGMALQSGDISEVDWALYDELLIERLRSNASTKRLITRDYLGHLPNLVFALQLTGGLSDYKLKSREEAKATLDRLLKDEFGEGKAFGYVFLDRGSFEKELAFSDPDTSEHWVTGRNSGSVILYGFLRSSYHLTVEQASAAVKATITEIAIPTGSVMRRLVAGAREEDGLEDEPQRMLPTF
jgi:HD superfamily phosphohydrolase